jgi:tRNA pseudouridine65 synthase
MLYRDESIAVFNKPTGLLLHRSFIDRFETRFALQLARNQLGQHVYPVHRLDKPTSGVLLFALTPQDAAKLTSSFSSGVVKKKYLAVTRGITPPAGLIDYPLVEEQDRCDPYAQQDKEPQSAITGFNRLATVDLPFAVGRYPTSRYSLVEVIPHTGRRHQIRRHFKHIFHPLMGDVNYGEGRHNRFFRDQFHCPRLLLHAAELTFPHPVSDLPMTVTAPLDETFARLLQRLEWQVVVPDNWFGRVQ